MSDRPCDARWLVVNLGAGPLGSVGCCTARGTNRCQRRAVAIPTGPAGAGRARRWTWPSGVSGGRGSDGAPARSNNRDSPTRIAAQMATTRSTPAVEPSSRPRAAGLPPLVPCFGSGASGCGGGVLGGHPVPEPQEQQCQRCGQAADAVDEERGESVDVPDQPCKVPAEEPGDEGKRQSAEKPVRSASNSLAI